MRRTIPRSASLAALLAACCPYRGPLVVPTTLSGPSEVLVVWPTDRETFRSLEFGPRSQRALGPEPARSTLAEFLSGIADLPTELDEVLVLEPAEADEVARARCREIAAALLRARPDLGVHVQPVTFAMAAVDSRWEVSRVLRDAEMSARYAHGPEDGFDSLRIGLRGIALLRTRLFDDFDPAVVLVPLSEGPAPEVAWIAVSDDSNALPTLRRVPWDEALRRLEPLSSESNSRADARTVAWFAPPDREADLVEEVARLAGAALEITTIYFGRLDRPLAELDDGALLEFIASTPVSQRGALFRSDD